MRLPRCPRNVFWTAIFACLAATAAAADWPQWRGPAGDGNSTEVNLPIAWSEHAAIRWKCDLPGWGDSTPCIWGDAIFLTSQVDDSKLVLVKVHRTTGKIEWTRDVGEAATPRQANLKKTGEERRHQKFHESQNLATPSPVTDGQVVIVHFGNGELAAYDFQGERLWRHNLQEEHGDYTIWWGHANSPVLAGDLVISICVQDSCADLPGERSPSYVIAHNKRTGAVRWKVMRETPATAECGDSYTTPILRKNGERTELVVWGGQQLDAYDPATGKQLWKLGGLQGNRVIPTPVAAHGLIFAIQGMRAPLLAVRPDRDGELDRQDIAWKFDQGTSDSPSPICVGEQLLMVNNDGVLRCFEAVSGRTLWKERLKGEYRASPVAAEGRVYFLNTAGLATVVSASRRYDRLTENQLDDKTLASPAIAGGNIFIRGEKKLYCLGR